MRRAGGRRPPRSPLPGRPARPVRRRPTRPPRGAGRSGRARPGAGASGGPRGRTARPVRRPSSGRGSGRRASRTSRAGRRPGPARRRRGGGSTSPQRARRRSLGPGRSLRGRASGSSRGSERPRASPTIPGRRPGRRTACRRPSRGASGASRRTSGPPGRAGWPRGLPAGRPARSRPPSASRPSCRGPGPPLLLLGVVAAVAASREDRPDPLLEELRVVPSAGAPAGDRGEADRRRRSGFGRPGGRPVVGSWAVVPGVSRGGSARLRPPSCSTKVEHPAARLSRRLRPTPLPRHPAFRVGAVRGDRIGSRRISGRPKSVFRRSRSGHSWSSRPSGRSAVSPQIFTRSSIYGNRSIWNRVRSQTSSRESWMRRSSERVLGESSTSRLPRNEESESLLSRIGRLP